MGSPLLAMKSSRKHERLGTRDEALKDYPTLIARADNAEPDDLARIEAIQELLEISDADLQRHVGAAREVRFLKKDIADRQQKYNEMQPNIAALEQRRNGVRTELEQAEKDYSKALTDGLSIVRPNSEAGQRILTLKRANPLAFGMPTDEIAPPSAEVNPYSASMPYVEPRREKQNLSYMSPLATG